MKLLVMQFSPPSVTSSLFGPNILLSTLFSNTLSLGSSFNVRNQFSHAYKITGKKFYILQFLNLQTALKKAKSSLKIELFNN
jgi:hypothetical protein